MQRVLKATIDMSFEKPMRCQFAQAFYLDCLYQLLNLMVETKTISAFESALILSKQITDEQIKSILERVERRCLNEKS